MKIIGILFVALILRIFITFYQGSDPNFNIQQDNYADYAVALSHGFYVHSFVNISDTRLFPAYPIAILLLSKLMITPIVAGYLISLLSGLLSIYLFWKLTKNSFASLIFAIFPLIWVTQSVKVATEPLTVLLLLISILLYKSSKLFYAGLVLGLAADVRLIAIALLGAFILQLFMLKRKNRIANLIAGFMLIFGLLFVYNYFVFGGNGIFRQFTYYPSVGHASIGFIQIFQDFAKVILSGEYRTLLSGGFYVIISIWSVISLFKKRKLSNFNNLCFYWLLFSLIFIFIYGPASLLGEYRRFLVPVIPALIVGLLPAKIFSKNLI